MGERADNRRDYKLKGPQMFTWTPDKKFLG